MDQPGREQPVRYLSHADPWRCPFRGTDRITAALLAAVTLAAPLFRHGVEDLRDVFEGDVRFAQPFGIEI